MIICAILRTCHKGIMETDEQLATFFYHISTTYLDFMFGVVSPAGGTYPGFALGKRVRQSRHSRSSVSLQQE